MIKSDIRLCTAILTLAAIGAALASCGQAGNVTDVQTTQKADESASSNTSIAMTTDYMPELPIKDYGGDEFLIMTSSEEDDNGIDWVTKDVFAETATGDVVTDAVFERNMWLEETFNILVREYQADTQEETEKAVLAGITDYDAVMTGIANGCEMGQENYVLDLCQIPYIDLTQDWWDQGVVSGTSIGGRTYIATGDITIVDNDATWVLMFNKAMAQSYDFDFYDMVENNQWDMEAFYSCAQEVVKDLNGDGKQTGPEDQFGFATRQNSAYGLLFASDIRFSVKDSDDYPVLDTDLDRLTEVVIKAGNIMSDVKTTIISGENGIEETGGMTPTDVLRKVFEDGRALFYGEVMQCVTRMRESTTDFGLIPYPKYDLEQENYYHFVHSTAGKGICIPTTQPDPEMAGIIIEAMAAKSVSTLTEAYYDKALTYKYMRDEESAKMLDIILDSRVYDLAYIYAWGDLYEKIHDLIIDGKDTVVSTWDKRQKSAGKALQRTIDAYMENE